MPVRVLIVDDDQDILDSLEGVLTLHGDYEVKKATDVVSVKSRLKHFIPDIVLLDINLGSSNGLDLISLLKAEAPDIDCIIMTAHRDVDYAVKALRYGAVDYLFKPVDPSRLLRTMDDFYHQRRIKQEQAYKQQNLKTILDQTSGFILLLSPAGICIEVSQAALSYIKQGRDKIVGELFTVIPWWEYSDISKPHLQEAINIASSGQVSRLETEIYDHNYHKKWFEFSLKPVFDEDNQVSLIIAEGHDLTEHKQIEQKFRKMALYDPLTGLANRVLLYEHLGNTLAYAARNQQKFSVFYIDLDNFKLINDSLGHRAGDDLLINIGECLKNCMRKDDVIARVGGDEFVVVLRSESENEGISIAAERLMQSITQLVSKQGHKNVISASIGIAVYPEDGQDADTLLHNADVAMYGAKNKGKNCFQYYSS
ncbi:MAG: diguanylate cyclase [Gammaproteobacteria bacterium]|nr:diguanylate cyclase [Gammaproteobacteria bacterium]